MSEPPSGGSLVLGLVIEATRVVERAKGTRCANALLTNVLVRVVTTGYREAEISALWADFKDFPTEANTR